MSGRKALDKGKVSKGECNNYRGISLLSMPERLCESLNGETRGSN